eukprot:jgi/Tetstr1/424502/TSEL_015030.t1
MLRPSPGDCWAASKLAVRGAAWARWSGSVRAPLVAAVPRSRRGPPSVVAAATSGRGGGEGNEGSDRDESRGEDRSVDGQEWWEAGEPLPPPPPPPQRPRRRRDSAVVTSIRSVPDRVRRYFRGRIIRQKMWQFIAFGLGYLCGQFISLEFGNLGVNDVVAGAMSVWFVESVTFLYYDAPSPTLRLRLLNYFKLGYTASLMSDAFKLAGTSHFPY